MTLEILTSDTLSPIKHGFFTRRGGASSGIFKSLNCGFGSSDQNDVVALNRERVAAAMDVDTTSLISVHQVHSTDVVVVADDLETSVKADGMVTTRRDVALGILTADCQPVLFADKNAGVIGAAHAGWKGALDGVLEVVLEKMEICGADRSNIIAIIGPTISPEAYEVGPEFLKRFQDSNSNNRKYFSTGQGDRLHFDLPGYSLNRLREAGVKQAEWLGYCTYSDPDRFFSYRRATHEKHADYGRLISTIRL